MWGLLVYLVKMITECVVASLAVWAVMRGIGQLRDALEWRRWHIPPAPADPVAAEVWAVLDDARRITITAAEETDV